MGLRAVRNALSTNWSGYAAYGTSFTNASARWTVPAVNCNGAATGASSAWVGLDGYGSPSVSSPSVEQLGTEQDCFWGFPSYSAWYELWPKASVTLPSKYAVHPYDKMQAWVSYSNVSDTYAFHMQNFTAGWVWNLNVPAPTSPHPTNTTAEWIVEQPDCFYTCSWLANYGTVSFSNATASKPSSPAAPIGSFSNDPITLQSGSTVKSVPSALTNAAAGSSFTTQFLHS